MANNLVFCSTTGCAAKGVVGLGETVGGKSYFLRGFQFVCLSRCRPPYLYVVFFFFCRFASRAPIRGCVPGIGSAATSVPGIVFFLEEVSAFFRGVIQPCVPSRQTRCFCSDSHRVHPKSRLMIYSNSTYIREKHVPWSQATTTQ